MDFWKWFLEDEVVKYIAEIYGFTVIPEMVRDFVLDEVLSIIKCDGEPVYREEVAIEQVYALINTEYSCHSSKVHEL